MFRRGYLVAGLGIVRGFHGTTVKAAQSIVAGSFSKSSRPASWLGFGRYFFQDSVEYADQWAKMTAGRATRQHEGGPAVVAVDIDLSYCMDLAGGDYWDFIRRAASACSFKKRQLGPLSIFLDQTIHNKTSLGFNYEDCDVMNAVIASLRARMQTLGGDITTVRGAFIEGLPMHERSWLFSKSCIMLSVLEKSAFASPFTQVR